MKIVFKKSLFTFFLMFASFICCSDFVEEGVDEKQQKGLTPLSAGLLQRVKDGNAFEVVTEFLSPQDVGQLAKTSRWFKGLFENHYDECTRQALRQEPVCYYAGSFAFPIRIERCWDQVFFVEYRNPCNGKSYFLNAETGEKVHSKRADELCASEFKLLFLPDRRILSYNLENGWIMRSSFNETDSGVWGSKHFSYTSDHVLYDKRNDLLFAWGRDSQEGPTIMKRIERKLREINTESCEEMVVTKESDCALGKDFVLVKCKDNSVRVFDMRKQGCVARLDVGGSVHMVTTTVDRDFAIVGSGKQVQLWSARNSELLSQVAIDGCSPFMFTGSAAIRLGDCFFEDDGGSVEIVHVDGGRLHRTRVTEEWLPDICLKRFENGDYVSLDGWLHSDTGRAKMRAKLLPYSQEFFEDELLVYVEGDEPGDKKLCKVKTPSYFEKIAEEKELVRQRKGVVLAALKKKVKAGAKNDKSSSS